MKILHILKHEDPDSPGSAVILRKTADWANCCIYFINAIEITHLTLQSLLGQEPVKDKVVRLAILGAPEENQFFFDKKLRKLAEEFGQAKDILNPEMFSLIIDISRIVMHILFAKMPERGKGLAITSFPYFEFFLLAFGKQVKEVQPFLSWFTMTQTDESGIDFFS